MSSESRTEVLEQDSEKLPVSSSDCRSRGRDGTVQSLG